MASFVIHNIAGEKFLSVLKKEYGIYLTEKQENKFLLGNLIVDSSKIELDFPKNANNEELKRLKKKYRKLTQEEKIATHFRSKEDLNLSIQVPQPLKFIEKYQELFTDLTVLGYLFHLYTDKIFFEDLFLETIQGLDKDGKPTIYIKETKTIKVLKNGKTYTTEEFLDQDNKESIYHDYTKMNKILLEHYGTSFNKEKLIKHATSFINPGIEEVDYNNIIGIINKTSTFIKESYKEENNKLNVFDENIVKNFINVVVNKFISEYPEQIELACKNNIKIKKNKKKNNTLSERKK